MFPSSTKREIRHFHVVVVQWRQRNVQKSVIHVQSCCFANPAYGIFAVPVAVVVALTPYCFGQEIPNGLSLPNLFFHNPSHSPYIIYLNIIFIFSEKEPRIGGLEKGQLSNNNGNKNVKIKK